MNRWIVSLSLATLAACQTGTQTNDVEQAVSSADCVPGGNFADAKMPELPLWDGKKPLAKEGQLFMDVADWREDTKESGKGFHVGVLVEPGSGQILWGATIPDDALPKFRHDESPNQPAIGDCCRPPPCCRGCCNDWMTANLLEAALRYIEVADHAAEAAGKPKY